MSRPRLRFAKMSGAGNDFVVLGPQGIAELPDDVGGWVRRVCRRGLSVGAAGVLLVEPDDAGRIRVRFHNPDGSDAFCGNGSRCAARFARLEGLAGDTMTPATSAGELAARVEEERVRLELPPPRDDGELTLELGAETLRGRRIHAGTPHFVTSVENPAAAPLERWGPGVRHHPQFAPRGVNLDVVRIDGSHVQLRTWEKGVERETLACGSGAVAAAFAARAHGAGERVIVVPASGVALEVEFGEAHGVALVGDARLVYEGCLDPEALSYAGVFDDR